MLKRTYTGAVKIKANELNLDLTLLGGQSFRWRKLETKTTTLPKWVGVAYDTYWELTQQSDRLNYAATPVQPLQIAIEAADKHFVNLLERYFRLDFDLPKHIEQWRKAHTHFAEIAQNMNAVRMLAQEPFENILSFMCSQNNNIKRISAMIQWLCAQYGQRIERFNDVDEFTFPTFEALSKHQSTLETSLRGAKFGYRAKFIAQAVAFMAAHGGDDWLKQLQQLSYDEARLQLVNIPGIGFKVADCICLMSLGHLQAVPIDTHIYKIVQRNYMPQLANVKSVTPKIYAEILKHFQNVYGAYAGWAQTVLFCSSLQQFQVMQTTENQSKENVSAKAKKKKRLK